jgi:hypothetical protein
LRVMVRVISVVGLHQNFISGGYIEEVTPVPIPNTVVKLFRADDTWRATARKNRTLPVLRKRS